jgi:uncharacterized protein (TIGR03086 family)
MGGEAFYATISAAVGRVRWLPARQHRTRTEGVPMREPMELLVLAIDEFGRRLRLVGPDDWTRSTPCTEWDVRALVNHVVGANVRYELSLHGASTAQVEATRTVDHLGDDPFGAFIATSAAMVAAFHEDGALDGTHHHVTGDRTGRELLAMRILDLAVHGWDLARAIGTDEAMDNDVVEFLLTHTFEVDLGPAFAVGAVDIPSDASQQDRLLYRLGRHPNVTEEVR